jgi:hypothetical protein
MNKPGSSSSGSNAGVVILIAILALALPCLAGVMLLGAGFFYARTSIAPLPPPTIMAPSPTRVPVLAAPPAVEEAIPPVAEPTPNEPPPNEPTPNAPTPEETPPAP